MVFLVLNNLIIFTNFGTFFRIYPINLINVLNFFKLIKKLFKFFFFLMKLFKRNLSANILYSILTKRYYSDTPMNNSLTSTESLLNSIDTSSPKEILSLDNSQSEDSFLKWSKDYKLLSELLGVKGIPDTLDTESVDKIKYLIL